jgi:hypothetical protein
MGKHDSSRTRVAPVFNWLQCWDPTGKAWLLPLLRLAAGDSPVPLPPETSRLREAKGGPREAKLPAPRDLLVWLVQNCEEPELPAAWGSAKQTQEYRRKLVSRDPATVSNALASLQRGNVGKAAHVLEGVTRPDALLGTDELLVVVEGKRTESVPTTCTSWMSIRHQMLRHLDGAWEQRGRRRLLGLIILDEARAQDQRWRDYPAEIRSTPVLEASLPHRSPEERRVIAEGFLGVTTWQRICSEFRIPEAVLPEQILEEDVQAAIAASQSTGGVLSL